MHELQQKINYLEAQIAADKAALGINLNLLKQRVATPQFIIPGLIGIFCLGYFMPHVKHVKGTLPLTLIKNLQTVLPLIIG
ncbi:MAG: hypothetical protein V4501_09105 [Pseudomonadota bacterium]